MESRIPQQFIASPTPFTVPGEDEAVIVIAKIADIKAVKLPADEMQRGGSMGHSESRGRYLAGRYLVRSLLSAWFSRAPEEIPMALGPAGKPFLSQDNMPHFSISHSGGLIGAIFHAGRVGIDLEQERSMNIVALARRFFSPEEAAFLAVSGSLQDFFRLWCCREAAIKADGRGLASLLESTKARLKVADGSDEWSGGDIHVEIEGVLWHSISWVLSCGTHGAVAFRERPRVIRWCDLR
jgi:phosphopantetheinyl transferase